MSISATGSKATQPRLVRRRHTAQRVILNLPPGHYRFRVEARTGNANAAFGTGGTNDRAQLDFHLDSPEQTASRKFSGYAQCFSPRSAIDVITSSADDESGLART